jgi:hypothetical protein
MIAAIQQAAECFWVTHDVGAMRDWKSFVVIVLQRCLRPTPQFHGRPPSPPRSSGLRVVEPKLDEVVNTTGEELG